MSSPRILFVYQFLTLGGVEVVMQARLRELTRRGIEGRVLFLASSGGGESIFKEIGDRIAVCTDDTEIERYLANFNPDWISTIDTPAILPIARRVSPQARIAYEVHTPYPVYYALLLDPYLLEGVSGLLVPSQSQKEFIALRIARPMPIEVVPNSIQQEFFQQTQVADLPRRNIVMWVGRLDEEKNWRGFIEVAAQVREGINAEFWLVGGLRNQEEKSLFEAIKRAGLIGSFRWLPAVNYEDMPRLYSFVGRSGGCLLSTSWGESFGMAALEAMASRCPVIAPDIVGLRDIVKHGQSGWLYPPMNTHRACDFVLESFQDPKARQSVIETADQQAKTFTPAATIDRLLEIFSDWSTNVAPQAKPPSFERKRLLDRLRARAESQATLLAEKGLLAELLSQQLTKEHFDREQAIKELTARHKEEERLLLDQLAEKERSLLAELAAKEGEIRSLSSQVAEGQEKVRSLSLQLATKQGTAKVLSEQLSARDYELEKITNSLGWRLMNRYGRIKYRYLLPIYKALGLPPYDKKRSGSAQTVQPHLGHPPDPVQSVDPLLAVNYKDETATVAQPEQEIFKPGRSNTCDIVCFPIIDWDFRFQRPQQLMSRFASAGHRVFYVSQTFRSDGDPWLIQQKGDGIYEVSLRGPAMNVYSDTMNSKARDDLFSSLNALRRELSLGATAAFVQLPFWWPLAKKVREEFAWPTIYDCMDFHSGFSTNSNKMLDQEEDLLRSAELVITSSTFLEQEARQRNSNVVLVRNACDYEHFVSSGKPEGGARPVIGYYGAIADWFDSDLVADLAERRPDWDFVLVGSTFSADVSRLSQLPNIVLPGEKHYSEIPAWLGKFDVAIIPFKRIPLTEATNPVKAYEILAAGKPLVSVPIPEVAALAPLVRLASSVEEFESEIISALNEHTPEFVEKRRAFAREHTWVKRFELLAPAVRNAFPRASIIIVTYNNLELNRLCLESLYARTEWPNFEVIVVDNASTDGTAEYLKEAEETFPDLRVILNDANLGFARANNIGLKQGSGGYLCLLNNDTVLARGWLSTLIRHLHTDPKIGLIGPVTNEIGNEAKIPVGYTLLEDMPLWAAKHVRENDNRLFEIPMLAMFCVVIKRETIERVGLLDESFEIGMFEDDDYAHRIKQEDYKLMCACDSFIHHAGRASFKLLDEDRYVEIFQKNRRTYEQKWGIWKPHIDDEAKKHIPGLLEQLRGIVSQSGVDASRVVVFLPSIGWNTPLVQRPQHIARELARQGFLVFFDCSGSVIDHIPEFFRVETNLWLYKGPIDVLETLENPILWALPYNAPRVDRWKKARIVYDFIDDLSVFPYKENELRKNHEKMLHRADLVLCVAKNLIDQVKDSRPDAVYSPNAAEYELFSSSTESDPSELDPRFRQVIDDGRPIAGYYGAIASWLDVDLLAEVAQQRTDWNFVLIGQKLPDAPSLRPLEELGNFLILRQQPYKMLPNYLAYFTTAMIPFKINQITVATSPIKLYEYFAGGKPVISTCMPECEAFSEVLIVHDAGDFSAALETSKRLSQDARYQLQARNLGRKNSWAERVRLVAEELSTRLESRIAGEHLTERLPTREHLTVVQPAARSGSEAADQTRKLARQFNRFRTAKNKLFFEALTNHFAPLAEDPRLPMYFEDAVTCNDRGRALANLLQQHTELSGKKYLDVGCAYGGFLVAFAECGAEVTGIDIDEVLLHLGEYNLMDNGLDVRLFVRDATRDDDLDGFQGNFDIITCNNLIEYVQDPQALLHNISKMLRDDGVVYFEIPNRYSPRFVLQDGRYQVLGTTLLDHPAAGHRCAVHRPGSADMVRHYLGQYIKAFESEGLKVRVLPETFANISVESILNDVAELRGYSETGLSNVPSSLRGAVSEYLSRYLHEVESAPRSTDSQRREFELHYGVNSWKVLGHKAPFQSGEGSRST